MKYILLLVASYTFSINAQTEFTKKYIMPFHYCTPAECANPVNHKTTFAESDDGMNWSLVPNVPALQGSVPDAIIRDTIMYIFNPGTVRYYHFNTQQFDATTHPITIHDLSGNVVSFVDPSPIIDANGDLVLFYLNSTGILGDPAGCSSYPCTKYFNSAVEVPGSNGTQFIQQAGDRLALTINDNAASDPDLFFDGTNYNLYISRGSSTNAYYSSSLHGTYVARPLLSSAQLTNNGGIPSGYFDPLTNEYWLYVHANGGGPTEIRRMNHSDFSSAVPGYTTIITGTGYGFGAGSNVASPGFLENTFLSLGMELKQSTFSVYPNPATTYIVIQNEENDFYELIDLKGNSLKKGSLEVFSKNTINIQSISNGFYFLKIGESVQKIMIEHN